MEDKSIQQISYRRLVRWEYLTEVKHNQHEAHKTQKSAGHRLPIHGTGGRVNTIPNEHVKVPVHLQLNINKLFTYSMMFLLEERARYHWQVNPNRYSVICHYRLPPVPPQIWMVPWVPRVSLVLWPIRQLRVVSKPVQQGQRNIQAIYKLSKSFWYRRFKTVGHGSKLAPFINQMLVGEGAWQISAKNSKFTSFIRQSLLPTS